MDSAFVTIARIVKTQGRRGEVAADLHTDFPELFAERKNLLLLAPNGVRREFELEEFWPHKGRIVLKFRGVDSINDAETLIGHEIQIPHEKRAPLEPGAVYISDLVGCVVAVAEPESREREIGNIADVIFGTGEAPTLVIRSSNKEYLVPFADEYLREMDVAKKRVLMSLPPGMLELDAPLSSAKKTRQARSGIDDE